MASPTPLTWPAGIAPEVAAIKGRYPQARAATLPLLWVAQRAWGWISPEAMDLIARELDLSPAQVRATASFYTMLRKEPVGVHVIQACRTLSCDLAGAPSLLAHLEGLLGIRCGQTTPDGLFTLEAVECLASCGSGPVLQVTSRGDHALPDGDLLFEHVTADRATVLVEALRNGTPLPPHDEADQWTWEVVP